MLALFLTLLCVWGQFWYARPGYFDFDNGFCLTCSGFLFGRTHHPHNVCLFIHSSYNSHRLLLYFCISSKLLTLLCSSLSWIYSASFCSLLVQLQISLLETVLLFTPFLFSLYIFLFPSLCFHFFSFFICLKPHVYFKHFLKFYLLLSIYFEKNSFSLHILSHTPLSDMCSLLLEQLWRFVSI